MALILNLGDRKRLRVAGLTDAGVRAPMPATPTWSVAPPGVVALTAADDVCGVRAVGAGDCVVTATSGGISTTFDVSVIAPAATRLVINAEDLP